MVNVSLNGFDLQFDLQTVLVWALVGLVAGFLASRVMLGHGMGPIMDIAVGILGALLGGFLASRFGVQVSVTGPAIISQIIIAFAGALILLMLLRLVGVRGDRPTGACRRREGGRADEGTTAAEPGHALVEHLADSDGLAGVSESGDPCPRHH